MIAKPKYQKYQLFDELRNEELATLESDIVKRGVLVPVEVDESGDILDGHNRVAIAKKHGLPYGTVVRTFATEDAKREHVIMLNLARRHLDPLRWGLWFKRLLEAKGVKRGQGARNDQGTSATVAEVAEAAHVPLRTVEYRLGLADEFEALPDDLKGDVLSGEKSLSEAKPRHVHVSENTGEPEWYTPREYIEAARTTMGGIELDPASSQIAQEAVKATRFHTVDDDGLSKPWAGRVWLNPPYASDLVGKFTGKLAEHYAAGDVTAACVLVNNATETKWFGRLFAHASAFCFTRGRVKFLDEKGEPGAPLQGQTVVYLGSDVEKFLGAFDALGNNLVAPCRGKRTG